MRLIIAFLFALAAWGQSSLVSPVTVLPSSAAGACARLREKGSNGTSYIALCAPDALSANTTYKWPSADGTNGQCIKTNASGVLSFGDCATGGGWVDYSNSTYTRTTTGSFRTATLPANTLAADGDAITGSFGGTLGSPNNSCVSLKFGSSYGPGVACATSGSGYSYGLTYTCYRASSSSLSCIYFSVPSLGAVYGIAGSLITGLDFTSNITLDYYLNTNSGATITIESLIMYKAGVAGGSGGGASSFSGLTGTINVGTQIASADKHGNGSKLQMFTGTSTTNHCAKFDADGNVVDAGGDCASGGATAFTDLTGTINVGTQIASGDKAGNGSKLQMRGTGTPATDDCAKFDANGNVVSAGGACGTSTPAVTSVFGRTGAVVAATSDYSFSQIGGTFTASQAASKQGTGTAFQMSSGATTSGHCVQFDANGNTVDSGAACGGASVSSVFGRTGAVTAATNDYSFSQISGTISTGQLPTTIWSSTPSQCGDGTSYAVGISTDGSAVCTQSIPQFTSGYSGTFSCAGTTELSLTNGVITGAICI